MKNVIKKAGVLVGRAVRKVGEVVGGAVKVAAVAAGVGIACAATAANSHAEIDTALTGVVTDMTGYFGTIKVLVISVVVFGIAIGYAKMTKKK